MATSSESRSSYPKPWYRDVAYHGYRSVNVPILTALVNSPCTTGELATKLKISVKERQPLYVRLSQLRRDGYIDKKFTRQGLYTEAQRRAIETERELKGSRPKGRQEWWKWTITEQGKQALDKEISNV